VTDVTDDSLWRRCSACKEPIALGAPYYVCSVSTCNRKRTGLAFCSVSCWEVHLPVARHREAWAVEETAPRQREAGPPDTAAERPARAEARPRGQRRIVSSPPAAASSSAPSTAGDVPRDVLIVASRLKDFVRACSGFNTSDRVLDPLSDIVREVCEEAIRNAERDGRKTVLDRDIPKRR
jgi:hypothetical protein